MQILRKPSEISVLSTKASVNEDKHYIIYKWLTKKKKSHGLSPHTSKTTESMGWGIYDDQLTIQ